MSSILADTATLEYSSRQPWPDDAQLFQPYEAKQILLSEFASCISVRTFLKMAKLTYKRELRANAESMSPSGKVPFIKVGSILISELEPVVSFVRAKNIDLSTDLSEEEKTDQKAFMSLANNTLVNAELYLMWIDKENRSRVTFPRYGHAHPWPLSYLLPLKKQWEMTQLLKSIGWAKKSINEVYDEVKTCCEALSEKLGENEFFFNKGPTELDALIFGHLYTLITVKLPSNNASEIVCKFSNLVAFCRRVEEAYFRDSELDRP